ncbi:CYFA0S38e00386g1_1 [Cyberlindnera fabianii]|uniref:Elongator complex protein 5 n=1 Tax=Cyberlindnera fabianii TaxID=36022 RepID=A0A061BEN2_CYBFA|nr:Elongator complex protein 5 [Cyberlindnera fabianii]CDR47833.1 CYFA0S38e00386g1_1 [Cyberlindnera fabianii]
MSTSQTQSSTVLLNRLISLKETSPLLLVLDTIAQSSYYLIEEFIHHKPDAVNVIYVSFETIDQPEYANSFIGASRLPLKKLMELIEAHYESTKKNLVIIDSINSIATHHLSNFMTSIIRPNVTVLATFHTSVPEPDHYDLPNYPSSSTILTYIASTIFEIVPNSHENEDANDDLAQMKIPKDLNTESFVINVTNRRKSGRSLSYQFHMNTRTHEYTPIVQQVEQQMDKQQLLKGLTTFNLETSAKQQRAKESVELPYLEAQKFDAGGAIVYEFEKDDDYDEEDPYEDPF